MKTIEIVSIPVSNQEKAKSFYQKMGFEVVAEAPMGNGDTWVQLGFPNQPTSISLVNWSFKENTNRPGSLQGLILETEDIEKEVKDLSTKGVEVGKLTAAGEFEPGKIDNTPWGKFAWCYDPDGNGISIHQK